MAAGSSKDEIDFRQGRPKAVMIVSFAVARHSTDCTSQKNKVVKEVRWISRIVW